MKKLLTIFFLIQFIFGYTQCIEGDCENGTGTFKWENGNIYKGEWKAGGLNGQGKLTSKSGGVKEGEWKDGLLNGQGKIYSDGDIYEGEFKDGELNGQG